MYKSIWSHLNIFLLECGAEKQAPTGGYKDYVRWTDRDVCGVVYCRKSRWMNRGDSYTTSRVGTYILRA